MSLTANDITAQNFKTFYDALIPYLGSYDKGKLTFVGEVKAFFAETAPNGFLICDGATYDKADYPQLANLLLSLTDHSAYEVSGDDTKFKVPDLRGEFLRGTGTNSHTNQGSGANVGVHQDGTLHFGNVDVDNCYIAPKTDLGNKDYSTTSFNSNYYISMNSGGDSTQFTSRPTNTSVLYCIAYKDTMVDIDFLSYGGERFAKSDMYDTNERVIGKWIDGKPLYKKTIMGSASGTHTGSTGIFTFTNLDTLVDVYGNVLINGESNGSWQYWVTNNILYLRQTATSSNVTYPYHITLAYTKTTDTADSFKYSTPTDYSTEEKIVGTWIDGKPLWQKTIVATSPTVSSNGTFAYKEISHGITNIDKIVSSKGDIINGSSVALDMPAFTDVGYKIKFNTTLTQITIANDGTTWNNSTVFITLQYTKTTD